MKGLDLQVLVKACANTRYKARKFTQKVSFLSDILLSLIIVKEPEGVAQMSSVKKLFLEHLCQSLLFNKVAGLG